MKFPFVDCQSVCGALVALALADRIQYELWADHISARVYSTADCSSMSAMERAGRRIPHVEHVALAWAVAVGRMSRKLLSAQLSIL